jgi:hypothetical protein
VGSFVRRETAHAPGAQSRRVVKTVQHAKPRDVYLSDDHGGKDPERRAQVWGAVERAFQLLHVKENVEVVTGDMALHWLEDDLPVVMRAIGERARVRAQQSYSDDKAKAKAARS